MEKSIAGKIRVLKKLLDSGIITQEEFESRKALLLETEEERKLREENDALLKAEEEKKLRYYQIIDQLEQSPSEKQLENLLSELSNYSSFDNYTEYSSRFREKLVSIRVEDKYNKGISNLNNGSLKSLKLAVEIFEELADYKDSNELKEKSSMQIIELEKKLEIEKKKQEQERIRKRKKGIVLLEILIAIFIVSACIYNFVYIPWNEKNNIYMEAESLFENKDYIQASQKYQEISGFKDSDEKYIQTMNVLEDIYNNGIDALENKNYDKSIRLFESISGYSDSENMINEVNYVRANDYLNEGKYNDAEIVFKSLGNYKDSNSMVTNTIIAWANKLFVSKDYINAANQYSRLGNNFSENEYECYYLIANQYRTQENYEKAIEYYEKCHSNTYSKYSEVENEMLDCKFQIVQKAYKTNKTLNERETELYNELLNTEYKSQVESLDNKTTRVDDSLLYGTWKFVSISGNYRIFEYNGTTASNTLYFPDGTILDSVTGTVSWKDGIWLIITGQRYGAEGNYWDYWMKIGNLTKDAFKDVAVDHQYYRQQ